MSFSGFSPSNHDTAPPVTKVRTPNTRKVAGSETNVEGGGLSRAVTRLHTMIGLTGYRTRDLLRIRGALNRLIEKA
jgi:hypothetical protein